MVKLACKRDHSGSNMKEGWRDYGEGRKGKKTEWSR